MRHARPLSHSCCDHIVCSCAATLAVWTVHVCDAVEGKSAQWHCSHSLALLYAGGLVENDWVTVRLLFEKNEFKPAGTMLVVLSLFVECFGFT